MYQKKREIFQPCYIRVRGVVVVVVVLVVTIIYALSLFTPAGVLFVCRQNILKKKPTREEGGDPQRRRVPTCAQENPLVPFSFFFSAAQGALGIISFVIFYPPPPAPANSSPEKKKKERKKSVDSSSSSSSLFYSVSLLLLQIISRADVELGGPSRRRLFKLVGCSLTLVACVDDTTTIYYNL